MTDTVVTDTIVIVATVAIDTYLVDTLMRDLVAHDRTSSSFLVFLWLWRRTHALGKESHRISLARLAEATGLSKSAVQSAVRNLARRKLVRVARKSKTAVPEYFVHKTWR